MEYSLSPFEVSAGGYLQQAFELLGEQSAEAAREGRRIEDLGDWNLESALREVIQKRALERPPEIVTTLEDPRFEVPGGERMRPAWLHGVGSIRAALEGVGKREPVHLCRCRFGKNPDRTAVLEVSVKLSRLRDNVRSGDMVIQGGTVILQLEPDGLFHGSVLPRIYRVICSNGMMVHWGCDQGAVEALDTPDALVALTHGAFVNCLLHVEEFRWHVICLREADKQRIVNPRGELDDAQDRTEIRLSVAARNSILRRFDRAARPTRWEFANAVTAGAHLADNGWVARRLELLGGFIGLSRVKMAESWDDTSSVDLCA